MRFGLAAVAFAVAAYGVWLLATVGDEFEPRGSVGVACLLAALVVGAAARRRSRSG